MSAISPGRTCSNPVLRAFLRRLAISLAILLAIAYLTLFGLIVGERGQAGLPARPLDAAVEALRRTLDYLVNHPTTYYWHRQDLLAPGLALTLFGRSAALLVLSLAIAALIGVPLGIIITLLRRLRLAPLVLLLSVLGISTPSFLLGMLFWVANLQGYRWLGLSSAPLPPTGFGWDVHVVMPALVLATRPLAQIVQITYVSLSNVLGEDYIRTAHAKGLGPGVVINRHALRNVLIPILTTLGTSLRFSLASLPVVEAFFNWPGVGLTLLQAIEAGLSPLVTDLIVSLGSLFLLINLALDVIYQVIDPRLREGGQAEAQIEERRTWRERIANCKSQIANCRRQIRKSANRKSFSILHSPSSILHPPSSILHPPTRHRPPASQPTVSTDEHHPPPADYRSAWWMLRSAVGNLPLLIGTLLVLAFFGLAVFGGQLAPASPSETHGVTTIEGKTSVPPFAPSAVFPWGSDAVGRDIQALVLAGARQTLTLALLGMLARMALGTVLGVLAGWWRGGWLDRLINGVVAVWAAFPVTLFTMILILALGIKQGMSVFVIALCAVGWGEIAQFVRGQVASLKPQPYIEATQSLGARTGWVLTRHVLPHLWTPLLVLAVLELGSVLMLLAELGFLNIFLGGGFKAEIGEVGEMAPVIYYFSDVPEWGALLANIRNWWRSYPWLAWYPGVAFFLAILTFNLWGEGLRRFLEDSRVNLGRLINRYTVIAAGIVVLGGGWLVRSTTPMEAYRGQAQQFDVQRAMQDIQTLASPAFQGRESGLPGARSAADYIAAQMKEIGLFPAGANETYFYANPAPRPHLADVPRLEILNDAAGEVAEALVYRQDFVECPEYYLRRSVEEEGAIVGLAVGPDPGGSTPFNLRGLDLHGQIILVRAADFERLAGAEGKMAGVLIVTDDPNLLQRRFLFPPMVLTYHTYFETPMMVVTPQVADQLLATAGSSLAQLDALAQGLAPGQLALTRPGTQARLVLPLAPEDPAEQYECVIGFIPGTGALMGEKEKGEVFGENAIKGLDTNVIIVSAYYDGLGIGPDGTLYPGANDNASGVAALLEMARVLKAGSSQPRKTIAFVAWSGGERREGFSVANAMNAKRGFNLLTVEAVIELSGVGAGSGTGIALGQGTSFSLVQLFQDASARVGVPVTTRGRGPHFGMDTQSGFGGRSALSAYVSWDGSDRTAHTAADTVEAIDPDKLGLVGQTTLLVVSVLGQAEPQQAPMRPLMPVTHYVQGARMFDEAQALTHIAYLASDELEGRRPGTPGGWAAGDYIAARFAAYGLQPAGPDGTYFQPFTAPYTTVVESPLLTVFTRTYTYHTDYMPRTRFLGSGEAEGQVVWLNRCNPGDFAGQDLAGKIVLCYAPALEENEQMIELALQARVGGILVVVPEMKSPLPRPSYGGGDMAPIPTFYITEAIAQDLLAGTATTLGKLQLHSTSVPLSTTVHMAATIEVHDVNARNVLGLLPGSDPDHQEETVIIGANYDALGRDPDGTIYNGAYVNGSGVAAMLEIARLWQAQGFRPARSVLFAAWDDQEQGWLGAQYYVRNPVSPLDHTVAMLNLNMVGRGEDVAVVGRGVVADQFEASARVYSATVSFIPTTEWGDSLAFYEGAVPTAMLACFETSRDSVYHRPGDDVENIQPGSLRTAGVLAAHALAAWSGGGPTAPLPATGPGRTLRDLILPTPTCAPPWPVGAMTCDHGQWSR